MTDTWIIHLDVDAFFASVEQIRNPRLKNKPVAVGTGCIASCSYDARRWGLRAGMSLGEARSRCPTLTVLEGDQSVYKSFASRLWEMASELAPSLETFLDDAYLDLTGTGWIHGDDPRKPAAELKNRMQEETGLPVTFGIGPSRMIARMASADAKPDGLLMIAHRHVVDFLTPRPVKDLPGVGPKIEEVLRTFNITTIGEMRHLPIDGLIRLFGRVGSALYERCRGRDSRIISAREMPHSISRETSFHQETTDRPDIEALLYYLLERGAKTLRELGLRTQTLSLKIRYCDFQGEEGQEGLKRATALERELFRVGCRLLDRLWTRRVALRSIGIILSNLKPDNDLQLALFESPDLENSTALAKATDAIRDRFGFGALMVGPSIQLLSKLPRTHHGYILRTPSLTK